MSQGVQLRKYGVQFTVDFELYEVDGVDLRTDWTPAQADCEVMKDGGASTMCDNTATDEGSTYSLVITATEAEAARLVIKVVDAATKVFLDKVIIIETYGNASAQHAIDLDDGVRAGLTGLANAVPGTAGGLATSDQVDGIGTATGAALAVDVGDDNYDGGISGVTSGTTKVGTQTATYAATSVADGTAHIMTHAAQDVDIVYLFQAGGGTSPVTIEWLGLLNPINDTLTLSVWNHVGGAWEVLGTRAGQTSTTSFTPKTLILYARHMGTSVAELGNVYLRLNSVESYDHIVRTDQVYVNYAVTSRTVGYADGAVWVDAGGTAGSVDYVNATADNPAPWANALTVAASLGLTRFHIANDDTITLGASFDDKTMYGEHYYLVLSDESINDSAIIGATISEAGTAANHTVFEKCEFIANASTGPAIFRNCGFNTPSGSPFLATGTGEAALVDCYSLVAGAGTPYFDFTGMTGGVNVRRWSGGTNITLDSANTLSLEVVTGGGQTVVTGGADVEIRGICRSVTITATAAETIQFVGTTGPITLGDDGASTATINLYGVASSVTDNTNGATVTDMTTTGADGGVVLADGAHGGPAAVLTLKNAIITGAAYGLDISGTAAGMRLRGGTTGIGLVVAGGSSSGVGVDIDSTGSIALDIRSAASDAVYILSSGGNGNGVNIFGNGSGYGIAATGGATGGGIAAAAYPGGSGPGLLLEGYGSGNGLHSEAYGTGDGIRALGGATSGAGLYAAAQNNNDAGAQFVKNGTGNDITGDTASFITINNLDHLMKTAVANNADMTVEVPNGTVLSNIMSKTSDTSTYVVSTDSLQGIADGVTSVSAAAIADAVWDELANGHVIAGSFGYIVGTNLDAAVSSVSGNTNNFDFFADGWSVT